MLSIGLVVNPVAGIGGTAGLAGSDGVETQAEALKRGAEPMAGERATRFLRLLARLLPGVEIVAVAGGGMGAGAVGAAGLEARWVVDAGRVGATSGLPLPGRTTAADTRAAVRAIATLAARPDVLVFVGGDGTARDVLDAGVGLMPVLGVPAGVKMQSAVFARSPEAAAALLAGWRPEIDGTSAQEVADIDEEARRHGRVVSRIWGELAVPVGAQHLQGGKVGQSRAAAGSLPGLAAGLYERLDPARAWLFGPGTTLRGVAEQLGLPGSLLGVDLHLPAAGGGPRESHLDLSAAGISGLLDRSGVGPQVVVSPVGGQGFLLGRGNQQIDAGVLGRLERDDLLVVATPAKLGELGGGPLYADLPVGAIGARLLGPHRVITGRVDTAMIQLLAA